MTNTASPSLFQPGITLYEHSASHGPANAPAHSPAPAPAHAPLGAAQSAPRQVGTVIIGGGFAGLATAMSLMERGHTDVMLLEGERIGHGASGRNGGFVFGGFSLGCTALARQLGPPAARALYRQTLDAVQRIRQRIATHAIDCDAQYSGVIMADWFVNPEPLREVQRFMRDVYEVDWQWMAQDEVRQLLLSERYHNALFEPNAFHFHPLKYVRALARVLATHGVAVHEQSRVTRIEPEGALWRVSVNGVQVQCENLVVCCGGYIERLYPALARAVLPIATYVMATEPLGERLHSALRTQAAVYDTRFAFDYYRPLADTRLLWGGRISIRDRTPEQVKRLLHADLLRVYPQLRGVRVTHAWSGLMSYARHQMPQIGRLPADQNGGKGLWYAMGFGGHGAAPTTLAGEVMAAVLVGESPIPEAFNAYGLPRTWGRAGLLAAQATYSWMQCKDAVKSAIGA